MHQANAKIDDEESDLDGLQLNYWTSLCYDKLEGHSFKNGQWNTRIRVTASVQLDQRLRLSSPANLESGSPFPQAKLYDFSERYGLSQRTVSSVFSGMDYPSGDSNDEYSLYLLLEAVKQANQGRAMSSRFTLERLWLGDGSGFPTFALGDCIDKITGREYQLYDSYGGPSYPQIVQLVYRPDSQKMTLYTRDLRYAEVTL